METKWALTCNVIVVDGFIPFISYEKQKSIFFLFPFFFSDFLFTAGIFSIWIWLSFFIGRPQRCWCRWCLVMVWFFRFDLVCCLRCRWAHFVLVFFLWTVCFFLLFNNKFVCTFPYMHTVVHNINTTWAKCKTKYDACTL